MTREESLVTGLLLETARVFSFREPARESNVISAMVCNAQFFSLVILLQLWLRSHTTAHFS